MIYIYIYICIIYIYIYIQVYIYIRAVNFNALTHVINLKSLTRKFFLANESFDKV